MEETIPDVKKEVLDLFGIKKLETPKTCRSMALAEFPTAPPAPVKDWRARAFGQSQTVVGLEGIKNKSRHKDMCGLS